MRCIPPGGVLPPASGFVHLDNIPARVMLDLAQRGVALAREHGSAQGPPVSLLDQDVIRVSSGDVTVGIPMRCVFALTAMGFLPQSTDAADDFSPESVAADEVVRVRVMPTAACRRALRVGVPPPRRPVGGAALSAFGVAQTDNGPKIE